MIKEKVIELIGKSLYEYNNHKSFEIESRLYDEQYQNNLIRLMTNDIDDDYLETPESNKREIKLQNAQQGLAKVVVLRGKTILVDENNVETSTRTSKTKLLSVGEYEGNCIELISKGADEVKKTSYKLEEPLRNLPVGNGDYIKGQQIIRYVKKVVLNGEENWFADSVYGGFITLDFNDDMKVNSAAININCDKIKTFSPSAIQKLINQDGIGVYETNGTRKLRLNIMSVARVSVDEFKAYLKENPITVFYELRSANIQDFDGITFECYDNGSVEMNSFIPTNISYSYNISIPYKAELKKQQASNDKNSYDIEANIVPYLMSMEYNLLIMDEEGNDE